jgi:hypothetical protein
LREVCTHAGVVALQPYAVDKPGSGPGEVKPHAAA